MRTLRDAIRAYPTAFYPQTWYRDEEFVDAPQRLQSAAWIAWQYLKDPQAPKWRRFIWADDYDQHGNRVYVGGVGQFGCDGFQVHRLLVPDERWVEWEEL